MIVRYDMTPDGFAAAYWYRWRTSTAFQAGALAAGLVPATVAFTFGWTLQPVLGVIAGVLVLIGSPWLIAAFLRQLTRRGPRTLMIDADGVSTEVASGQWEVAWRDVRAIVETRDYVFIFGRGINSVSVPVSAFADDAEREEFVRRARRCFEASKA